MEAAVSGASQSATQQRHQGGAVTAPLQRVRLEGPGGKRHGAHSPSRGGGAQQGRLSILVRVHARRAGVLQVEAMAQLAGIVMLDPEDTAAKGLFFFGGIENCRFRKPVVPGDVLVSLA